MSDESNIRYLATRVMPVVVLSDEGICVVREVPMLPGSTLTAHYSAPEADLAYEQAKARRKAWLMSGVMLIKFESTEISAIKTETYMHTETMRILSNGEIDIKVNPSETAYRSSGYRLWQRRDRTVVEPIKGRGAHELEMPAKRFEFDTHEHVCEFEAAFRQAPIRRASSR